jgi:hypothetical protein
MGVLGILVVIPVTVWIYRVILSVGGDTNCRHGYDV